MVVVLLLSFTIFPPLSTTRAQNGLSVDEKMNVVQSMYREYRKEFPEAEDISAAEARRLFEEGGVVFIDVRKQEEQGVSMLPEAVTEKVYQKEAARFEGKTVVAYCTIGYRSGMFAKKTGGQGTRVLNLSGGILAWVFEGGKVYHAGEETRRVHVYGEKWNYLPEGYEAVMF